VSPGEFRVGFPVRCELCPDVLPLWCRDRSGSCKQRLCDVEHGFRLRPDGFGLLSLVPPEETERNACVLHTSTGKKKPAPQLVVHAVVIVLVHPSDPQRKLKRKEHFLLADESPRLPYRSHTQ